MDKNDIEYLESCLSRKWDRNILHLSQAWYQSHDTLLAVAEILDHECCFRDTSSVIRFFEKPWHWENEMQELVDTYKEEMESKCNG